MALPAPLSSTSTRSAASRTVHRVAPLCRMTLVTPSRTAHAKTSRMSLGTSSALPGRSASIPAERNDSARPGQLAGQGELAEPLDGAPDVHQRVAREALEVGHLRAGPGGVGVHQPPRQLRLDGDDGQGVPQDVVQVARHPVALLLDREPGVLLPGQVRSMLRFISWVIPQVAKAATQIANERVKSDSHPSMPVASTSAVTAMSNVSTAATRVGRNITPATAM